MFWVCFCTFRIVHLLIAFHLFSHHLYLELLPILCLWRQSKQLVYMSEKHRWRRQYNLLWIQWQTGRVLNADLTGSLSGTMSRWGYEKRKYSILKERKKTNCFQIYGKQAQFIKWKSIRIKWSWTTFYGLLHLLWRWFMFGMTHIFHRPSTWVISSLQWWNRFCD